MVTKLQNKMIDEDFKVLEEDFSRWILRDGTILKARIALHKIFFTSTKKRDGYPKDYYIDTVNIMSPIIPEKLKKPSSGKRVELIEDIKKEINIDGVGKKVAIKEMQIQNQSYITLSGFKLTITPILGDVHRLKEYDPNGSPVYAVRMGPISKLEKIRKTRKKLV